MPETVTLTWAEYEKLLQPPSMTKELIAEWHTELQRQNANLRHDIVVWQERYSAEQASVKAWREKYGAVIAERDTLKTQLAGIPAYKEAYFEVSELLRAMTSERDKLKAQLAEIPYYKQAYYDVCEKLDAMTNERDEIKQRCSALESLNGIRFLSS